jgi:DnaD/phage-associated family protein
LARSRNIKPGFFENDLLAEIEPLGRLLFAGLWTIADREGRLEDRPQKIKALVLPYDNCDVNHLLDELAKEFITRYQVGGKRYIAINNWMKHQNPHKKEQSSTIPAPAPNKHHTSTVQVPNEHGSRPADSLNLIPDSLNSDSLNMIPDSPGCAEPEVAVPETTGLGDIDSLIDDDDINHPGEAYRFYEQELGRPLSPTEFELIAELLNLLGLEMFKLATKRAIGNGKRQINYIRTILENWKQANIRSPVEVQQLDEEFKRWKERNKGKPVKGFLTHKGLQVDKFKDFSL